MKESEQERAGGKARTPPVYPEAPMEDEIDLLDYVEVIVRRRWMIILWVVICTLVSFAYVKRQSVSYRSEANVLPSQTRDLKVGPESAAIAQRRDGYPEALRGPSIRRSMLERTVPWTTEGRSDSVRLRDYFGRENMKQALDGLAACSEFKQDASGVMTIAATLEDSTMAAAVANAYVEELILFYTEKQQKQTQGDLEFIASRLRTLEMELGAAEDSLVAFQRANISFDDPRLSLRLARLQRRVSLKSSLYTTLANQYELARIEARKEAPAFEVLNYARAIDAVPANLKTERTVLVSAAVGLFASIFLAFLLEYVERNRQSGRMEPILNELGADIKRMRRLFGWNSKEVKR